MERESGDLEEQAGRCRDFRMLSRARTSVPPRLFG